MNYNKLVYFKQIFGKDDFNYISDLENINRISHIIRYNIAYPNGMEKQAYLPLLEKYYSNLASFCNWIGAQQVPYLSEGHIICARELMRAIELLKQPPEKRVALQHGGYPNKFNKEFLYGLHALYKGIVIAFDPKTKVKANISDKQLRRFFLDNKVGLGQKFLFNVNGEHAFVNKLKDLSGKQLSLVSRLLVDMPINKTRSAHGWIEIGQERSPVRILLTNRYFGFGKDAVVFLFLTKSEHPAYTAILNTPPSSFAFKAA